MEIVELEKKDQQTVAKKIAKDLKVENVKRLKRDGLIVKIAQKLAEAEGLEMSGGVLEIMNEGIGFLRSNYRIGPDDVYVSQAQLRRYELRSGDLVIGHVRPPRESERHQGLLKVESVNGLTPDEARRRPRFENLTPIFPNKLMNLEYDAMNLSTRMINLVAPIGGGQRAMIVSPPPRLGRPVFSRISPMRSASIILKSGRSCP